jgi:flagellar hook-associated protein 1 FlgK
MAKTIVEQTNTLHRGGYSLDNKSPYPDGTDFFLIPDANQAGVTNWASYITVNPDVYANPNLIAAAQYATWGLDGEKQNFGDGMMALAIAQLKHDLNSEAKTYVTDPISAIVLPTMLPATGGETFYINYNDLSGTPQTAPVIVPYGTYNNLAEYAAALEKALQADPDLQANNIKITVRCLGDRLSLSSLNTSFNGGTLTSPLGTGTLQRYWPTITSNLKGTVPPATLPATGNPGDTYLDGVTGELLVWSANQTAWVTVDNEFVRNATMDDFWRSLVANVGVDTQEAERMLDNQLALMTELENKRQSVQGVSIDEEMTDMIRFQHAYNAAARFMTTIDEELNVIINQMGLVGR